MESCEVFFQHVRIIAPPKKKFILCICPEESFFFFINSDPPPIEVDAGVEITPRDLDCLDHVSYVDTSKIICLATHEISDKSSRGKISLPLRRKIVKCAKGHGILPERFMRMLENNFL